MKLVVGERTYEGRAIDLADDPDESVDRDVEITCPDPGPLHEHVGVITPEYTIDLRSALAAVARSRGISAPQDDLRREARRRLAAMSLPEVETGEARRRLARAGDSEERLRERVAAARGRLEALRERSAPEDEITDAQADLREATRRLSEAETERIAARQALDWERRAARRARDQRRQRLALQDRIENLDRAARKSLAEAVYDEFADAVDAVPGEGTTGSEPGTYEGDPITAGLGVARIATLDGPVVLSIRRFPDATTAARRLEVPVVRL